MEEEEIIQIINRQNHVVQIKNDDSILFGDGVVQQVEKQEDGPCEVHEQVGDEDEIILINDADDN